jgi:predicted homoserine dehydrogenase-like protein
MIIEAAGSEGRAVRAGLIGVGQFGHSLLAQAEQLPGLSVPVLCDLDPDRVARAVRAVFPDLALEPCESVARALAALEAGRTVLVGDSALMMELPFDVLVEATGHAEAAAANAERAIEAGRHVAMVSKEADSVVGPILHRKAADAGLVHTPVDGDQPSLLIQLIAWARGLGLEIAAAGKSSEYDFVFDPTTGTATSNRRTTAAPGFEALWPLQGVSTLAARALALQELPQRTVPDFCEMGIVCNATGLRPDEASFHAPVMRPVEVADVFCPKANGGLLDREGAIDVFNCLRRTDEASFAGGVFVVVRCRHRATWEMLREKGHVVSTDDSHAMLYHPAHLLGVEAPGSLLRAVRQRRPTPGMDLRPVCDLVARTGRPFAAGTELAIADLHSHSIEGLEPLLVDAGPIGSGRPLPYYLLPGCRLTCDVPADTLITAEVAQAPEGSALRRLRAEQDRAFL